MNKSTIQAIYQRLNSERKANTKTNVREHDQKAYNLRLSGSEYIQMHKLAAKLQMPVSKMLRSMIDAGAKANFDQEGSIKIDLQK